MNLIFEIFRRSLSLSVAIFLFSPSLFAFDFKAKGVLKKSIHDDTLRSSKNTARIAVIEPHESQLISYKGVPFSELMDQSIGTSWREADEILFTCTDGYQPSIPVAKFKRFKAWLVWGREDGKPFQVTNKLHGNEHVTLGPYYLVWDNNHNEELLRDGADDFPYQIVSLDLISFKDKFAKIAPPPGADVNEGFLLYRKYCMKCHTLNGEGGAKGPELKTMDFVGAKQRAIFRRWILAPQEIRKGTTMPAFGPHLKDREQRADKILDYLARMTKS